MQLLNSLIIYKALGVSYFRPFRSPEMLRLMSSLEREGQGLFGIMPVRCKAIAIVLLQSVLRADPDEAKSVLVQGIHLFVDQSLL